MKNNPGRSAPERPRQALEARLNKSSRWLYIFYLGVMLLLLASGGVYFRTQRDNQAKKVRASLEAIANLKQDQIIQWRAERLSRAAEITEGAFIKDAILTWLEEPTPAMTARLQQRFEIFRSHQHFTDVLLVDPTGQILLSLSGTGGRLHKDSLYTLEEALRKGRPQINNIYSGTDLEPSIDVLAPIFRELHDGTHEQAGALVMKESLSRFLYPMIQSWPVPSTTAETLLVRRDGDHVLFLNELRHRQDTTLKLRIPLTERGVPAVQAVLGRTGWFVGNDYRGAPVVSVIMPVPDSNWFMVAKMDQSEAFDLAGENPSLVMALMLLFSAAASSIALIVLQRINRQHILQLYEAETARRKIEERYHITLMSIGDAVIATDPQGYIELLNPVAETLTAWTEADASGQPLEEVFHIIHEETRQSVENPVKRVMREGKVVGLANHTMLVARDGHETPIADSGAPIRDEDGSISGAVLVFRDQTQERNALRELEESENKFAAIFRATPAGIIIINVHNWTFIDINPGFEQLTGYTRAEAIGRTNHELDLWVDNQEVRNHMFRQTRDAGLSDFREMVYKRKDGTPRNGLISFRLIDLRHERVLLVILNDITERKQFEEQLQQSIDEKEVLLRELYHRTKNNMQLIQSMLMLQTVHSTSSEVHQLVENTGEKIQAMALVHQMLYRSQDLSRIDLHTYIHDLAGLAIKGFQDSARIKLCLDLDPVRVMVDVATPVGLVINELLTNSLKHAFPDGRSGEISIQLNQAANGDLRLRYADDGVGAPEGLDLRQGTSFGMFSVFNIIEMQLNGKIEVKNRPGLEFKLQFSPELYGKRV